MSDQTENVMQELEVHDVDKYGIHYFRFKCYTEWGLMYSENYVIPEPIVSGMLIPCDGDAAIAPLLEEIQKCDMNDKPALGEWGAKLMNFGVGQMVELSRIRKA